MKAIKIFSIIFCIITFMFVSNAIAGNSDSDNVAVNVSVNPIFSLQVSPTVIDFGSLNPNESSNERVIEIKGISNYGRPVIIRQKGDDFVSGFNTIEIENVEYEISKISGTIGLIPHGIQELEETYNMIYKSINPHHTFIDVVLKSEYVFNMPDMALMGDYGSTFTVTMTE